MSNADGHSYLRTHTLQAEHLVLDLEQAAADLEAMLEEGQDRRAVTLVKQHGMNLVLTYLVAGAALQEHSAPGPATVQVLVGRLRVRVGDDELDLRAGHLVAFDANVRHRVEATEDSTFLLTLSTPNSG